MSQGPLPLMLMVSEPQEMADALAGKKVLFIHYHRMSGAMFELGQLVRRDWPVKNDAIPELERLYEGTHSMYIKSGLAPPFDSRPDDDLAGSDAARRLDALAGHVLVKAEFRGSGLVPVLTFDNGVQVADASDENLGELPSYTVRIGSCYWSVEDGGITEEQVLTEEMLSWADVQLAANPGLSLAEMPGRIAEAFGGVPVHHEATLRELSRRRERFGGC